MEPSLNLGSFWMERRHVEMEQDRDTGLFVFYNHQENVR